MNADIGEADHADWVRTEQAMLNFISSASIACGGHAGDAVTMRRTICGAKACNVTIGAHPAFPDKAHFGRRSMRLGRDISPAALQETLTTQMAHLRQIAREEGTDIVYVKPHGALYNDAVRDPALAALLVETVVSFDAGLYFMGAPQSQMQAAAKAWNVKFIAEGFVDRCYTHEGHLQSRQFEGAVITTPDAQIAQAVSLACNHQVRTLCGTVLDLQVDSLCLHGDSPGAARAARAVRMALQAQDVVISAFASYSP